MYPNHLLVVPTISIQSAVNYELWTQQFVGIDNRIEPILVDTIRNGSGTSLNEVQLFTDKIKNLMGRKMRLAAITYIPYTIAEIVVYA